MSGHVDTIRRYIADASDWGDAGVGHGEAMDAYERAGLAALDALVAESQVLRDAVLAVADGMLTDPCWCGDEWWALHDLEAEPREHSEWCARLRLLILDGTNDGPPRAENREAVQPTKGMGSS